MSHDEAVWSFAVEKYLLDELSVKSRDDFEEHLFDCQECALDLRVGATFLVLIGMPAMGHSSDLAQQDRNLSLSVVNLTKTRRLHSNIWYAAALQEV